MSGFSHIQLYVRDPARSAAFYTALLGREPVEASATFVLFAQEAGLMLGLWARHMVEPAAPDGGLSGELGWLLADPDAVHAMHGDWQGRGISIAQPPTEMDFGTSFVALDPDGNRLRVFSLADA